MILRGKRLILILAALCLTVFLFSPLEGQSIQYGKLTGKVMLAATGEPIAGVRVEISSSSLVAGKRSTLSNERGMYVFLNLPIGAYKVTAILDGFKTASQKDVKVSAASVASADLLMEEGQIEQTVEVTGQAPMVDLKTSTLDTKITSDLLSRLPTTRDAFYDLSLTTPGMYDAGKEASWLPSPTAYGGATNENVFLVNGVNTTNPRGASWGSLVKVNYNTVQEVRVVSLGSKAEYGSFSGAAIDVITKSGGSKITGSAGFYTQLGRQANNQPTQDKDFGEWLYVEEGDDLVTRTRKELEANLTLGGPLIKDILWFYTGFALNSTDTKVPIFTKIKGSRNRIFDFKLTSEPGQRFNAWASYHFESNENTNESWNPTWDDSMVYGADKINHTLAAQLNWNMSDVTIFGAKYLGFWTNDKPNIPSDAPDHPGYINWWKWAEVGVNGAFPYVEAQKSSRNTVQADVSHYAENFLGEHDIKFGVQYTRGRGNWMGGYFHGYANFAYPYRWTQNINYLKDWYGDTGLIMYNRQEHLNPFLTVRTSDSFGVFLDDQWSPSDRLTVNIGLRFDRMSAKYGEGKVYDFPATPEGINDPPAEIRTRKGSDNIFDFKTFSPRLGLTYQLTKDGKTVLRANYGRYYMPMSVENLRRFGPDMPATRRHWLFYNIPFDKVDLNNNGLVDYDEVIEATRLMHGSTPYNDYWTDFDTSWALKVSDKVKDQHTDQLTFSIEREILRDLSLEASYIYKRTSNLLVNWPINKATGLPWEYERKNYTTAYGQNVSLYGVVLKDYNSDGAVDGADVQWVTDNTIHEVVNMPKIDGMDPSRTFHGFQLVFNKRYSHRWQMLASILYSHSSGSAPRSIKQEYNIEGPMIMDTLWAAGLNMLVNNMEGPLPFTPKWEIKFSGSYCLPVLESDLGVRLRFSSGRPLWPLEAIPNRTPWSNPDNAVVTTGDNWIVSIDPKNPRYLPASLVLDLSLSRSFNIGKTSMAVTLDLLNVFNAAAVIDAGYQEQYGRIMGFTPPRKLRVSLVYSF